MTKYTSDFVHQECSGYSARRLTKTSFSMYKKNKYWDIDHIYDDFPVITGFPELNYELTRPYFRSNAMGVKSPRLKIAPKKCYLGKIINYPYYRWGAPMIKILGAKGEGKSNLLDLIMALQAAKGIRFLTFNDRRLEIRSLAAHGYFNKENHFVPFEIDIWIPKGYKFKKEENPLWDYYDNVHRPKEFETSDDIIQSMEPHKFTVVYEEAFEPTSLLRLWNDLVEQLAEETDSKRIFTFAHHEWARLIPENPSEEINKLVKRASINFSNFRKDKIGLDATFHSNSYSFYQVIQRIGHLIQKSPIDKNRYSKIEKEALSYKRGDFAIAAGGRGWMKHSVRMFPELPDEFRLIAQRNKMLYPDMIYSDESSENEEIEEILVDHLQNRNSQILMLASLGYTHRWIGDKYDLKEDSVRKVIYREKQKNGKKKIDFTNNVNGQLYTQTVNT